MGLQSFVGPQSTKLAKELGPLGGSIASSSGLGYGFRMPSFKQAVASGSETEPQKLVSPVGGARMPT